MSKSFQELQRTAPASFHVVCKTFLNAWKDLCFHGRVKAGFLHLGTTFREDQSLTVSQWAVDSTVLLYSSLQASATTAVAALREELAWVPDPSICSCCAHRQRGRVTTGFLPERPLQNKQLAGGWGNVGLDLLPVIVLIHSWLLLHQFLAVFHGADIAFLLLLSKSSWKKRLLLLFPLYVQKLHPTQKPAERRQWHGLASSEDNAATSKQFCKQKSRRL